MSSLYSNPEYQVTGGPSWFKRSFLLCMARHLVHMAHCFNVSHMLSLNIFSLDPGKRSCQPTDFHPLSLQTHTLYPIFGKLVNRYEMGYYICDQQYALRTKKHCLGKKWYGRLHQCMLQRIRCYILHNLHFIFILSIFLLQATFGISDTK